MWLPKKAQDDHLDFESELATVMGEDATDVSEKEALNFVLEWVSVLLVQLPGPGTGLRYTVTNDVSVRKLQVANAQW